MWYRYNISNNCIFSKKTIPLTLVTGFAGKYTLTADFSQFEESKIFGSKTESWAPCKTLEKMVSTVLP